jgi:hypothetical protein
MANLNLLPDYYVKERFRYRIDMICVMLFAVVMAGVIIIGKRTEHGLDEVKRTHEKVDGQFDVAAGFVKEFFAKQHQQASLRRELVRLERLRQPLGPSYVLAMITEACPEDVSLRYVRILQPGPVTETNPNLPKGKGAKSKPPKAKIPEYLDVEIQGRAEAESMANAFEAELQSHILTAKVNMPVLDSVMLDGKMVYSFRMSFQVETNSASLKEMRKQQLAGAAPGGGDAEAKEATP